MPQFAILRMERTLPPTKNGEFPEAIVNFRPLALLDGKPLTLEAESPELALASAIRKWPHFRPFLATQELHDYLPANPSRIFREAKTRSPRSQG